MRFYHSVVYQVRTSINVQIISNCACTTKYSRRFTATQTIDQKGMLTRPLPERAAAVFLAQYFTSKKLKESSVHMMPLTIFINNMPSITRDDIFGDNLDVTSWIKTCKLFEIVYADSQNLMSLGEYHKLWSSQKNEETELVRQYGAIEYVKLTVDPHQILSAFETNEEINEKRSSSSDEIRAFSEVLTKHESQRTSRWFFINEAILLAKREATKYSGSHPLKYFLTTDTNEIKLNILSAEAKKFLWIQENEFAITSRKKNEATPPLAGMPDQPKARKALSLNNHGGWGSQMAVPTKEDVYEILRYVPINWGSFGNLNIPPKIKKKHIRCSATMQWFRRQPHYFELRDMNGTVEIRRSCMLHPEHHNMTSEQAKAFIEHGISTGTINSLVVVGPDGQPVQKHSPSEKNLQKFFYRVCPAYFVPFTLILQRCNKKNITLRELQDVAVEHPEDFEIVSAVGLPTPFVRKRAGADSTRWKKKFIDDLTSRPDDIPALGAICNHLCATWDRLEYVYVLLSPSEQCSVGGFETMTDIIRRHPELFRVGERFACRIDSSDPLFCEQPEPVETEMTSRTYLREENPYLSSKELAKVFHFIISSDETYTPSFFVRGSSPAMRVALPTRISTVLQEFPRLFACKETTPGVFSIRKVNANTPKRASSVSSKEDEDDLSWLAPEEGNNQEPNSRRAIIDAVKQLIPSDGVDYERLLLWASLQVQRAVNSHYGSLLKMLELEQQEFKIIKKENSITVQRI